MMKIASMQPYFLPYIGYFQLINCVDKFIIGDDVQYIKHGWINRNRILINGKDSFFTLPIKKDSYKLNINERYFADDIEWHKGKIIRSFELAYNRAPFYHEIKKVLCEIFDFKEMNLSKYVTNSLLVLCDYMDIKTPFYISSDLGRGNSFHREDAVIDICKLMKADHYINPIGGTHLYSKERFRSEGIELNFIKMKPIQYKQYENEFIGSLSIIDVLMFNPKDTVKAFLNEYELT